MTEMELANGGGGVRLTGDGQVEGIKQQLLARAAAAPRPVSTGMTGTFDGLNITGVWDQTAAETLLFRVAPLAIPILTNC